MIYVIIGVFCVVAICCGAYVGKNKKKNIIEEKPVHPVLGEMEYLGISWILTEKLELKLWNQIYKIPLYFYADSEKDDITEEQVIAFKELKNVIIEKQHEIEAGIMDYVKYEEIDNEEILIDRLIPCYIKFSRKGECALFVEDTAEDGIYNDDTETAFALVLLPKLVRWGAEDTQDFLNGGGGYFNEIELYGEEITE